MCVCPNQGWLYRICPHAGGFAKGHFKDMTFFFETHNNEKHSEQMAVERCTADRQSRRKDTGEDNPVI